MGIRGYDPREKQSSPMSNATVLSLLEHYEFAVQRTETPVVPKATTKKAVKAAQNKFGIDADISQSGESIHFMGQHFETKSTVRDVRVKLSNMLGLGELKALYEATGIPEFKPARG